MREILLEGWTAKFPHFHTFAQTQFRTVPEREPLCVKDAGESAKTLPSHSFVGFPGFTLLNPESGLDSIRWPNARGGQSISGVDIVNTHTVFTLLRFTNPRAMFPPRLMPKRILIVEDEVSVRNAVRVFLEHHSPFEVCGEAANGVEAVEKANALQPDLVILDLSMPHMNGIEAASLLRSTMPTTPVVVYTMFGDVLGKQLASALGVAAIVSKSDGLAILLARIEALLESSTLVQPPAKPA